MNHTGRRRLLIPGILVTLLAVVAAGGGYLAHNWFGAAQAGENSLRRPDFTLPDHEGVERSVSEWDGKLLIVNFWATWCPPCLKEIPIFVELQETYAERGVQFIGVAIDEPENVNAFLRETPISYPVLIAQMAGIELGRQYGNTIGALPFTAFVSRSGEIVFSKAGPMTAEEAEETISAHL